MTLQNTQSLVSMTEMMNTQYSALFRYLICHNVGASKHESKSIGNIAVFIDLICRCLGIILHSAFYLKSYNAESV
jgi:hypothetical protein